MSNINNNINLSISGIPSNAISIVGSVANEEFALASLLEAQANLLCNALNPCITVCDFIDAIQSILQVLNAINQKNNVLENKLRDTLNFIQVAGIGCLDCNKQFELLNDLNSVLNSIGEEEFSLACLIAILGKALSNINCYCTFNEIKKVNNLVVTLMNLIVEINMILLRELRIAINLIKFIKNSKFDIFIKIKEEMLCAIKNIINSIFKEERGLSELIFGESVKISCALKMCLNEEELSELDSLIGNFINVICNKKRVLESKLDEILSLLNTIDFCSSETDIVMCHVKELQLIESKGKHELSKLIKNNSRELNRFIDVECCNYNELINFNDYIIDRLICFLNDGCTNKSAECKQSNSCGPCCSSTKSMINY